ncbi:MAG: efflux RND transporter periplasmic adaptor subunit [Pseudomonadota bacterium]
MNDTDTSTDLAGTLAASARTPRRKLLIAGGVLALLGIAWMLWPTGGKSVRYLTEASARGALEVNVSATGNLYPTNQVDVGSELSGIVEKVLVDENDHVTRGQVLAQLDLSRLGDQVVKSQAAVLAAEAQVAQAQATVKETRATLARLRQVAEATGGKVPSRSELEAAEAAVTRADANEANARAAAAQAAAALRSDQTNLSKASIRSPIDGIVLTRKVEPGQTVAASLQAPVLFTIAEDLTRMKLQVDVDEADVSQVKNGQTAYFTVDAWPGRKYPAKIERVGFGAQTTDGVVTYKTLLDVVNDDLSLRPGMTATAEIATAHLQDVLLIPNAALRFTPPRTNGNGNSGGFVASLFPRRPPAEKQVKEVAPAGSEKTIWVLQQGKPVAFTITTGLSNGRYTAVSGGDLQPGMAVITGVQKSAP